MEFENKLDENIKARDIMEEDFPILGNGATIEDCMDAIKKSNFDVCIILKKGIIYSILDSDDLVREYIKKGDKKARVSNLDCNGRFAIIKPETSLEEIIRKMEEGIEYFIVKGSFIGLITKEKIAEKNHLLFETAKYDTTK